jgi:hypothetical protein
MSWRVAYDPTPDDPNPHAWDLSTVAFPTQEEAEHFAQSEETELLEEYGQEYINDWYRWLVVQDTVLEPTVVERSKA